jgi:hypothetical protein
MTAEQKETLIGKVFAAPVIIQEEGFRRSFTARERRSTPIW